MLNAQWPMLNGQWSMLNAQRSCKPWALCIEHWALCPCRRQSNTAMTGPWSLLPNSRWTTHEVAREAMDWLAMM